MPRKHREKRLAAARKEILAVCEAHEIELETEYDTAGPILLAASEESKGTTRTTFLKLHDQ